MVATRPRRTGPNDSHQQGNTKPKRNSLLTLNDCEVIAKVFGFANALELIGFAQTQQDKLDTKPAPMVAPQPQRDRGMVNGSVRHVMRPVADVDIGDLRSDLVTIGRAVDLTKDRSAGVMLAIAHTATIDPGTLDS
jgi:hypothetical protein